MSWPDIPDSDRAEYERSNPSPSAVSVSAAEPIGGGARKPVASDFGPGRHRDRVLLIGGIVSACVLIAPGIAALVGRFW